MSALPDETIGTVLDEIRAVAAELVEIKADVAKATQHFGDVDALQIDVESIKRHLVKIDIDKLEERLAALERKQAEDNADREQGVEEAGVATDEAHRGMARGEAAPMIAASEKRTDLQIATMRERVGELGDAVKQFAKVLRENQSAVLVITGVAALVLAGLVLVLISAFGSPLPLP